MFSPLPESDIDAATAMMLLNSAPGHHVDPCKRIHKKQHTSSAIPPALCPYPIHATLSLLESYFNLRALFVMHASLGLVSKILCFPQLKVLRASCIQRYIVLPVDVT